MRRSVDILVSELALLRREQILPWVLVGLLLAMVFAGISGRMIVNEQRMVAVEASEEARALVDSLKVQAEVGAETSRSPGAVAYSVLSQPVTKAATPLEGLAIGQGDLLPDTYRLTARGAHTFLGRTDPENSLRLLSGNFDVAFIVVWVLPLLAIGFLFDVVAGERERGVLWLAVVAGASAGRFVWHKWWARFLLLAAVTTDAIVLAGLLQQLIFWRDG
jgi:ABC-2 type transport system permease protein